MKVDTSLIARAIASIEELNELSADPQGIGASTLRLVVDAIGGVVKEAHPRFNTGTFQIESLPIQSERQKQVLLAALGRAEKEGRR